MEKALKNTRDLVFTPQGKAPRGIQTVPSFWAKHSS